MIAQLEARVGNQLACLFRMGAQPVAAGEKGGRNLLLFEEVNDLSVEAGRTLRHLAEVEGQSDAGQFARAVGNQQRLRGAGSDSRTEPEQRQSQDPQDSGRPYAGGFDEGLPFRRQRRCFDFPILNQSPAAVYNDDGRGRETLARDRAAS